MASIIIITIIIAGLITLIYHLFNDKTIYNST